MKSALDNPAWEALTSEHEPFAQGTDRVMRYRPGILAFIACRDATKGGLEDINPLIDVGESFYIIGDLPALPAGWIVEHELPCAQMVLPPGQLPAVGKEEAVGISLLGEADADDMYELINSVQPGYYTSETRVLGPFYGIRQEGRLVAMAGVRMQFTGFSELSAICTHPQYTGLGYAQLLIRQLCRLHAEAGIVSFLHVALSNERAIRLYKHMGFEHRRSISFRRVGKEW